MASWILKDGVLCFLLLLSRIMESRSDSESKMLSELVEELFEEPRYNSRARPGADTGLPLPVFININVNDISSISEMKMEYSMTLYLRQIWRDERLAFKNYTRNVTLHHKQFDRIWTPDVFIRNLKAGLFHTITVPNRLIRLSPDGTILYSQRLTLTLACEMILIKYPMDNQTCKIEFGSYAYTTEDLVFFWRTDAKAVEVNPSISLPEYNLTGNSHEICSQTINSTGSFPCLRAHFHLERRLRAYVLSTYLPSMLVVLLSWVSFWIDLESVPARISLGILTMLTITTQSSGHLRGMPAISSTKAIDVWMATCLVFVFGSFIEYSVVNVLARREKHRSCAAAAATSRPSMTSLRANSKQETVVVNANYSPFRLFRRKQNNQSERGEKQEMIPLTNVQSGDEGAMSGIDDLSPARSMKNYGGAGGGIGGAAGIPLDGHSSGIGGGRNSDHPGLCSCCQFVSRTWVTTPQHRIIRPIPGNPRYSQALMVDVMSRILFPAMFLVFNIVYWPYYLWT